MPVLGADASPTTVLDASYTYTRTVTSAIVYTYTATDAADPNAPPGATPPVARLATSFATYITTFCSDVPEPTTERPVATPGLPKEAAAAAPLPAPPVVTMEVVTEHCSTDTYEVTECADAADPDCVVGMSATRVVTEMRTVQAVQTVPAPIPLSTSLLSSGGGVGNPEEEVVAVGASAAIVAPAPAPPSPTPEAPPQTFTTLMPTAAAPPVAAAGYSWPVLNGSAPYPVNGVAAPPDCVSCRVVNAAPTGSAPFVAGDPAARPRATGLLPWCVAGIAVALAWGAS